MFIFKPDPVLGQARRQVEGLKIDKNSLKSVLQYENSGSSAVMLSLYVTELCVKVNFHCCAIFTRV